jgi:hypothetical protein
LLRFTGLTVAPFPLRPRLFRYAKTTLVTSWHRQFAAKASGFRYAEFGITEVIPHPVLCRMVCDLSRFDWATDFPDAA